MDAAVYDLPFASVPTRKPRTPMEVPTPDLDRFNRSGPILMLLRNRHAMTPQFYPQASAAPGKLAAPICAESCLDLPEARCGEFWCNSGARKEPKTVGEIVGTLSEEWL